MSLFWYIFERILPLPTGQPQVVFLQGSRVGAPNPVEVARVGGAHFNTLWASQSVRSPRPVGPCDTQTYTF